MLISTGATYTRVAVVQLAYHPAALVDRRSPLEDPLFDLKGGLDTLLPRGEVRALPEALAADLVGLRARIRNAHNEQLLGKLQAVLAACRAWGVRLVVLPEYSVPWEILGGVADAAGEMVVVAGTHAVDRAARRSGVYERLVAPELPAFGQAVCPVLHRGRLLSLQPKLHPAIPERGSMKPGETWAPVAMPEGMAGPLGVMVCLDFLCRGSESHTKLVAEALRECRFLAVPSLTPHYTLPEFAGKAWEEARRYGRPVLYCDGAEGGGTAIYVDEGQSYDLRRFPERAGLLEPGDEGVIVADVNLGYERPGGSTRYEQLRPVVPVAEATFVYKAHPAGRAYAAWLEEAGELLGREDDEAVEALDARVSKGREVLLNAGALTGAAARGRRLKRLVAEIGNVTGVEEIRQFTREVVLPEGLLPLGEVRRAMAAGAAEWVFEWMKRPEVRAAGFGEVEARLREAGEKGAAWSKEAEGAVAAVARAVRGEVKEEEKAALVAEAPVRVVLPSGVDPAALGKQEHAGWTFLFFATPGTFQATYQKSSKLNASGNAQGLLDLQLTSAHNYHLLMLAEGATRIATVAAMRAENPPTPLLFFIVSERDGAWTISGTGPLPIPDSDRTILDAMAAIGLSPITIDHMNLDRFGDRMRALLPRFGGAAEAARSYREQRLEGVMGAFVEPDASYDGHNPMAIVGALDLWLFSLRQTALVLGEFGSGKSTALAEWAHRRWQGGEAPYPLLVNLAGAGAYAAPEVLLLKAAKLTDTPALRAALRLLVRHGFLVPCFDGFDEMATRVDGSELAGLLSALLEIANPDGKVLVSSRTNYFPSKEHLRTASESALAQALGASAGLVRLEIQPFSDEQVTALVRKIRTEEGEADRALARIAHVYDLRDLVHRPLLLGMVLNTLDSLDTGARIRRADLYDAYLKRWLDQTRKDDPECFTDEEKMAFAEALAEELWRSGKPDCTWQDLERSVRFRLLPALSDTTMPVGAALLEMRGGAFFVHEGEDRYRFAHKSFLEYFLARALVATVADRPAEVLATKPITPEVAAFVGEILRRAGDPLEARAVRAVSAWLTGKGRPEGGAVVTADAAANALRLLLGLARWANDGNAWIPQGADLRRVVLVKEDLRGASLVRADLSGADLSGADLSGADLSGASLEGTRLSGVRLERTKLVGVNGRGADFALAEADEADLSGADLTDAVLRQSMWTGCQWHGVKVKGAEVTGWAALGAEGAFGRDGPVMALSAALVSARPAGHRGSVNAVAWSPDGTRLLSGGDDKTVRLSDAATGTQLARLTGHTRIVRAVAWSPDGTRLLSGGDDGTVRRWDAAAGTQLACLKGHTGPVNAVAWSPGGTRLLSGGDDTTVRRWDAAAGTELDRLEGHTGPVNAVAWSPGGTRLLSGGYDKTVRLWDAATGTQLARLTGHTRIVRAVAWSPDGTRLLSGGDDGTVRLWDAAAETQLACLKGHTGPVNAVAWSPGGTRLLSGGDDTTVRLWDAAAGTQLACLTGHTGLVKAVAWSPDGTRLLSGGDDETVRLWDDQRALCLGVIEVAGSSTLTRTPGGFCLINDTPSTPARLVIHAPHIIHSALYLPLAGLRRILHRPDKVRAALSGDLSGDDIRPELERLGWSNGIPWDGKPHRLPRATPAVAAFESLSTPTLTPENPFTPGPALSGELPPGRGPLAREILALLRTKRPAPAILRGPRRSGKTSLLHHLRASLSPTHHVRLITLEGRTTPLLTADDLARVIEPSLATHPSPAEALRKLLQSETPSLLLLDEVANLHSADASLFAWLRAVGQEGTGVVLAGSHWDWVRVVERAAAIMPGSSFGNDITPVTLGPLRDSDALQFLLDTAPPDVPFARDGTATWILDLCGPWPFYLQVLGFSIVQAVREGERRALVESVGVHDLYDQRLLLDRGTGYFATRWAELPERARRILETLRDLPAGDLPLARDLPPEDLSILQDTGLCDELDHWLPDRPFYDWIRRIHLRKR